MGLSSKQVVINSDGLDWSQSLLQANLQAKPAAISTTAMRRHQQQNQQPPPEPLKCPRCDSSNTKFCYYNNYNKSQPRHFCRACKRHWTKGGTLRNVPVGGGRKNKRAKKSNTATAAATTATTTSAATTAATAAMDSRLNSHVLFQAQQPIRLQNSGNILPGDIHDQKSISEILYQAVMIQPPPPPPPSVFPVQKGLMSSGLFEEDKNLMNTSSRAKSFLSGTTNSSLPFPASFSSSTSSPFDSSASSFQAPDNIVCNVNYGRDQDQFKFMAESTVTSCNSQPPWQQVPEAATSNGMDNMPSYLNWDDIDTLVSTDHINLPWDDSHDINIKP